MQRSHLTSQCTYMANGVHACTKARERTRTEHFADMALPGVGTLFFKELFLEVVMTKSVNGKDVVVGKFKIPIPSRTSFDDSQGLAAQTVKFWKMDWGSIKFNVVDVNGNNYHSPTELLLEGGAFDSQLVLGQFPVRDPACPDGKCNKSNNPLRQLYQIATTDKRDGWKFVYLREAPPPCTYENSKNADIRNCDITGKKRMKSTNYPIPYYCGSYMEEKCTVGERELARSLSWLQRPLRFASRDVCPDGYDTEITRPGVTCNRQPNPPASYRPI